MFGVGQDASCCGDLLSGLGVWGLGFRVEGLGLNRLERRQGFHALCSLS